MQLTPKLIIDIGMIVAGVVSGMVSVYIAINNKLAKHSAETDALNEKIQVLSEKVELGEARHVEDRKTALEMAISLATLMERTGNISKQLDRLLKYAKSGDQS